MSILPSHKNGLFYVEHCKVQSSDDRLTFTKSESGIEKHVALPHSNLLVLILGPGTSLTQGAARKAAEEGVCILFTAGGGTPLYLASQNEYRPTKYCQDWMRVWHKKNGRLNMAKVAQKLRCKLIAANIDKYFRELSEPVTSILEAYEARFTHADTIERLLSAEGEMVKAFYGVCSRHYGVKNFVREKHEKRGVNGFLTQGNYLAYGIGSAVLWTLGIPHSLPLSHGLTRRGGLVFDVADLFKDSLVLPLAFKAYNEDLDNSEYRARQIALFDDAKIIKTLFTEVQKIPGNASCL